MTYDPADDVAAVLAFDKPLADFETAAAVVQAACDRLEKAGYEGADWVSSNIACTLDAGEGGVDRIREAMRMFREAKGSKAAFDYYFYELDDQPNARENIEHMLLCYGDDDGPQHLEAALNYAASVA